MSNTSNKVFYKKSIFAKNQSCFNLTNFRNAFSLLKLCEKLAPPVEKAGEIANSEFYSQNVLLDGLKKT